MQSNHVSGLPESELPESEMQPSESEKRPDGGVPLEGEDKGPLFHTLFVLNVMTSCLLFGVLRKARATSLPIVPSVQMIGMAEVFTVDN